MTNTVAVFGASGKTGLCLIHKLTSKNIEVRGLCRAPGSLHETSAVEITGTLDDEQAIQVTLKGCNACCILFGPRSPYTDIFCADATQHILAAMKANNIQRLICQTGAMIGRYPNNRTFLFEKTAQAYQRKQPEAHQDRVKQEQLIKQSDLNWTLIKTPRLTNNQAGRPLLVGSDVRVGLLSAVSRWDLAEFIAEELHWSEHARATVFVRA